MKLLLAALPYTLKGPADYHGVLPLRFRYLAPDAAASLLSLEEATGGLTYTDMYRTPESSLAAYIAHEEGKKKAGVQPPAFSPHNFGLAFDLDVGATLLDLHTNYAALTDVLAEHGWYCHRRDLDPTGLESHHFNWLGPRADLYLAMTTVDSHATWSRPAEERICERYRAEWEDMTNSEMQSLLVKARLYNGIIDGVIGVQTRAAIAAFQQRWHITKEPPSGGPITRRVLAVVTAEQVVTQALLV